MNSITCWVLFSQCWVMIIEGGINSKQSSHYCTKPRQIQQCFGPNATPGTWKTYWSARNWKAQPHPLHLATHHARAEDARLVKSSNKTSHLQVTPRDRCTEWEQHLHARLEMWCIWYNARSAAYSSRRNRKPTTHPNEPSPAWHTNKKAGETGGLPLQPTRPFSRGPGGDGNRENSQGWHNTQETQRKPLDIWASHPGAVWNQHRWLRPRQPASSAMTTSITAFPNLLFQE